MQTMEKRLKELHGKSDAIIARAELMIRGVAGSDIPKVGELWWLARDAVAAIRQGDKE